MVIKVVLFLRGDKDGRSAQRSVVMVGAMVGRDVRSARRRQKGGHLRRAAPKSIFSKNAEKTISESLEIT
jgi:hypothetical protein